jgi:hypothetical protein
MLEHHGYDWCIYDMVAESEESEEPPTLSPSASFTLSASFTPPVRTEMAQPPDQTAIPNPETNMMTPAASSGPQQPQRTPPRTRTAAQTGLAGAATARFTAIRPVYQLRRIVVASWQLLFMRVE